MRLKIKHAISKFKKIIINCAKQTLLYYSLTSNLPLQKPKSMLANFSHIWAQYRRYLRLSSIYFKLDGKSTYTLSHPTKRCTDRRTRYHIDTETPCFLHGLHQHAPVSIHDSFIRIFVLFFYVCLKSIDLLFFPLSGLEPRPSILGYLADRPWWPSEGSLCLTQSFVLTPTRDIKKVKETTEV